MLCEITVDCRKKSGKGPEATQEKPIITNDHQACIIGVFSGSGGSFENLGDTVFNNRFLSCTTLTYNM